MVRFHGVCLYFFLLVGIGPKALITLQRYAFVFIRPKLLLIYFCNHYNFYISYHLAPPAPIFRGEKNKKSRSRMARSRAGSCSLLFTGLNSIFYVSEHFPKSRTQPLLFGRLLRAVVVVNNFSLAVHQADADGILRHGEHGKSGITRAEAGTGHRFDGAGQRA